MTDRQRPLRVAIVGANRDYGWGGSAHMKALSSLPDFKVVAVCNSTEDSARSNAEHFNVPDAYSSIGDLAGADGIDLVSVCVWVGRHGEIIKPLLAAGKSVLCEWPLGQTTREAEELAALAGQHNARSFVGLQGRLAPAVRQAREIIKGGEIGAITSVRIEQALPFQARPSKRTVYLQSAESGADFLSVPVAHALDVMLQCTGPLAAVAGFTHTSVPEVVEMESGAAIRRTSPDQMAFAGALPNRAPVSGLFRGGTEENEGFSLEVFGVAGRVRIHGPVGGRAQMAPLALQVRKGAGIYREFAIPDSEIRRDEALGLGANVHRLYEEIAKGWNDDDISVANFEGSIELHRLIDAIRGNP